MKNNQNRIYGCQNFSVALKRMFDKNKIIAMADSMVKRSKKVAKMQLNRMCKCTIFSCLLSILINPTCTLDNGEGVNSSATESISYSITSLIDLITDPTIRKMCNFTTVIIIISKKE